jgi:hypothetical protein
VANECCTAAALVALDAITEGDLDNLHHLRPAENRQDSSQR